MSPAWKKFEETAFLKLKELYSTDNLSFELLGESNSNQSDILVNKNDDNLFYIEVKSPVSQAGQFVINKDSLKNWAFSTLNRTVPTENSIKIIDNLNTDSTIKITTAQTILTINDDIKFAWIKDFYRERNVEFILTMYENEYVIVPLDKLDYYFNIEGSCRKKGSGSGEVTKPYWEKIKNYDVFNTITNMEVINGKRYVYYNEIPNQLNPITTVIEAFVDDEFCRTQLEVIDDNKVYIRKLSTTSNPTVIFTLVSKKEQNKLDLDSFKKIINE